MSSSDEGVRCKLGYCAKKNSRYKGGDDSVIDKLREGICPICGGPTEKKYPFSQRGK